MDYVTNPALDAIFSDDNKGECTPSSVALSRADDVLTIASKCDNTVCICAFFLRGSPSCVAFCPVWDEACTLMPKALFLHIHFASKADAHSLMVPEHFPCVVVYIRGEPHVLFDDTVDTEKSFTRGDDVVDLVVKTIGKELMLEGALDVDEEEEAMRAQEMEEAYEEEEVATRDEKQAMRGEERRCDLSGPPRAAIPVMLPEHDLLVTHDLQPTAIEKLAARADDALRVCVLYFANWCGHCRTFKPVFNECVRRSATSTMRDHLAWCVIDCASDEGKRAAERSEHVKGFPTLVMHHARGSEAYTGARTRDAIWKFVRRKSHELK